MFSLPHTPDSTLTVASVTATLESVGDWFWLGRWLGVPWSVLDVIRDSHRGDRERKVALSEYFVNSVPGASWSTLAGALYRFEERKALRAVRKHLKEGKGLCGRCGNVVLLVVCITYMYTCTLYSCTDT